MKDEYINVTLLWDNPKLHLIYAINLSLAIDRATSTDG